jgi:glutamate---cysteine ligase / carboxylate-amine ligase
VTGGGHGLSRPYTPRVIPHVFGESRPWSVGIEEELFVLDARTLEPAPFPVELLDGERLKAELFTTLVELTTGICSSVVEAVAELAELRAEVKRRAAGHGLVVAAAGTWPLAVPEEQPISDIPALRSFAEYAGSAARRQFCCGLHVHVGVESPELCLEALEAVLPWLPLVLALSANSPYVGGKATGLASTRAELLGLLPRAGAPPIFGTYGDWERFAEKLVAFGLADSYTRIWWDIRPHPRYGTLELRMPDQPTSLETTGALAALLQALVMAAEPGPAADRGLYKQNRWAAGRFGAEAKLVHPDGSRLAAVPELLDELVARVEPVARRAGSAALLGSLDGLAQAGEQLELGRRGGLAALCSRLVELT